ncbi:MAG: short-chain dehydrogenase [Ferruginibacter sp.]|nr:short-chain dehydrogenase [Ferruginibacter sp.]
MKLTGNKILITGGGTGIGLGFTERFLRERNTVIICGRRGEILAAAADQFPGIITRVCDLSLPAERTALFEWIKEKHSDLDVLVNNAGMQQWMDLSDPDFFEKAQKEIAINIEAPLQLTALFTRLPNLSTIINVTSGLSFVPLTKVPVYSATKAFFHSFTLSLKQLLKDKHIEVIEAIPPALHTDLGGKGLHDAAPPVSDFIDTIFEQLKEGKTTLTSGFSEQMSKADPAGLNATFNRMNNPV